MDSVTNRRNARTKSGFFYVLLCVLNAYLGWQCFDRNDLDASPFSWSSWLINDVSAILYVLIFFEIYNQLKLKISTVHVILGIFIVVSPCLAYRFFLSSGLDISLLAICRFSISIIGINYLTSLTRLIHFSGSDEYRLQKVQLLGHLAVMRTVFLTIILFFLFKEEIPEWLISSMVVMSLTTTCVYMIRIALSSVKF